MDKTCATSIPLEYRYGSLHFSTHPSGLAGGIVLGLTDTFGPAPGAPGLPGFWIAAIASLWLVAVYLNGVSRGRLNDHIRTNY